MSFSFFPGRNMGQAPGSSESSFWRGLYQRRIGRQSKLAQQSWPEFFKGLAVETAVIVGILLVVLVVILILRG